MMEALTKEELFLIAPTAPKYSENLFKWCKKALCREGIREIRVFESSGEASQNLYIGYEFDSDFIGSRLWAILTEGAHTFIFSYGFDRKVVPDFWEKYKERGKCALDVDHRFYDDRWLMPSETERTCAWCGFSQKRESYTYTVTKERWVAAGGGG